MPYLQKRLSKTAHGIALASFPTVTGPGLRAIISGHRIINFGEFPGGIQSAGEADSILSRAVAGSLKTFGIGQQDWSTLFSSHGADLTIFPYSGPYKSYYDSEVFERARSIIEKGQWDFLGVHFFGTDPLGHMYGIHSVQYGKELISVDEMIDDLTKIAGPNTTFIMTADHGQMNDGSHGGVNMQVRQVPCVIWGHAVKAGELKVHDLHDIAQTMAVLLGVPPPVLAEGYPIFEALNLTPKQKSLALIHLLQQRYQRWSALHAVWPSLSSDPAPQMESLWKSWKSGEFDLALKRAQASITRTDQALQWFSRSRWVARLIMALWFMVLASCFGLAWPRIPAVMLPFYIAWAALFILQLPLPIFLPNTWPIISYSVMLGAAGMFIFSLLAGFAFTNMTTGGWVAWFLAAAGLLSSDIIDVPIWSWAVVWGIVAWRAVRFTYKDIFPQVLSLSALIACAAISPWSPVYETSVVRGLLPLGNWGRAIRIPWPEIELLVFVAVILVACYRWRTTESKHWKLVAFCSVAPLIAASVSSHLKAPVPEICWIICAVSLAAAYRMKISVASRALWLSLICLAYYRTLSHTLPWCFLSLASLVGWGLGWKEKKVHALSDGLGIVGLILLSYSLTGGGRLDLSHISVAEGYRALGMSWQPRTLVAIIVLKNISAIAASILPWLAGRSVLAAAGTLPMLGTLAAGNLTLLWFNRYGNTLSQQIQILEELPFIRLIWSTLFAWIILGIWAALHIELIANGVIKLLRDLPGKVMLAYRLLAKKMSEKIWKSAASPR